MFVLSRAQLQQLLLGDSVSQNDPNRRVGGSLLDVGAGDGNVTAALASLVDRVTSTEVSAPMVTSLNARGFNCVQTTDLRHVDVQANGPYDVIRLRFYRSECIGWTPYFNMYINN